MSERHRIVQLGPSFREERAGALRLTGMLNTFSKSLPCVLAVATLCFALPLGTFDSDSTVTPKTFAGRSEFNASTGEYTIAGANGEIGGRADSFHFVWKRVSGNTTLNADARFPGTHADKAQAALMIRQSLDPDAAYVAAVVYGNGQGVAQYRVDRGAMSKSTDVIGYADLASSVHMSLARNGDSFTIRVGRMGKMGGPIPFGGPVTVTMNGPVYVGMAVASGAETDRQATAVFSNVVMSE